MFISESNGNSFGISGNSGGGGMVGLACLSGERMIAEDMCSRLQASCQSGAFI